MGGDGQPEQVSKGKEKKQTAFSVFDDLDESESEEEAAEEVKEEEKKEDDPKTQFRNGADDLATLLTKKASVDAMGLTAE